MFKNSKELSQNVNAMTQAELGTVYHFPEPKPADMRHIERTFTRLFSTQDGQKVLSHLQAITFQRAYSVESTEAQLRYAEGQRALVATILRLMDRGRGV